MKTINRFKRTLHGYVFVLAMTLVLAACGGGGGGDSSCVVTSTNTCNAPIPLPTAYVGDDVGDYTFKYTAAFRGYKTDGKTPYGYHYGYREPKCKYLPADREDFLFHGGKNVVLGEYFGTSANPAHKGDAAWDVYAYRESYDFKVVDKTHMSFTHKISIHPNTTTNCDDLSPGGKRGEITRTGENTLKPPITNPRVRSGDSSDFWEYFLIQRTGTTMFTWMGKTKLPTGEEVDMFDVDLPELTNRNWDFQVWENSRVNLGIDLSDPLFNGRNKAKALVYMRRVTDPAYVPTMPWGYGEIQMIMDPTNYMTSVPLAQWQKFEFFSPSTEPLNQYDLP